MANNVPLLRLMGLPIFDSTVDLAEEMRVDRRQLNLFVKYSREGHYYRECIHAKPNGGARVIAQPGKRLKAIQAWVLRNIVDKLEPSSHAVGFRRGQGVRQAMAPHDENRYFLCMDLKEFFPSIHKLRVQDIFTTAGYGVVQAEILAALCTYKGVLPQGGVTSPAISNLVASRLDRRIAGYASRRNIIYTRYADDLTLSSNVPELLVKARRLVRRIVEAERFEVNHGKTRIMGPRQRCQILGLVKNNSAAGFGIGSRQKRRLRAAVFNAVVRRQYSNDFPTELSIEGWMSYAGSVDAEFEKRLRAYARNLIDKTGHANPFTNLG